MDFGGLKKRKKLINKVAYALQINKHFSLIGFVSDLSGCYWLLANLSSIQNEETDTLIDKVEIDGGNHFLALYRQKMWGGIIWQVFEVENATLTSLPSVSAEMKIDGKQIAYKFEASGYDAPGSYYLKPNGQNNVLFCSAHSCWEILCLSSQNECTVN